MKVLWERETKQNKKTAKREEQKRKENEKQEKRKTKKKTLKTQFRSGQVRLGQARPGHAREGHVRSGQVRSKYEKLPSRLPASLGRFLAGRGRPECLSQHLPSQPSTCRMQTEKTNKWNHTRFSTGVWGEGGGGGGGVFEIENITVISNSSVFVRTHSSW